MRRRLLALLALLLLAGCGIPAESVPRTVPSDSGSPSVPASSQAPSPVRGQPQRVSIYLVQNTKLVPVPRLVTRNPGPNALLGALLVGAPNTQEKDDGYRSVATAFGRAEADQVRPADGIVHVRLPPVDGSNGAPPPTDARLGYAQIVLTLTADDKVTGVVFVQDDKPIQVPGKDSSLSPKGAPVKPSDYSDLYQEAPK